MAWEKSPAQLYDIAAQRHMQVFASQSNALFKWRDPRALYPLEKQAETCPSCQRRLDDSTTMIPIGNGRCVKVAGRRCIHCDKFYSSNPDDIIAILQNNPFAREFTYNGERCCSPARQLHNRPLTAEQKLRKKRLAYLRDFPDAVMMICIEWAEGAEEREEQYVIISREHPGIFGKHILLYSTPLARELLTAATYEARHKAGSYNDRAYKVTEVLLAQTGGKKTTDILMPKTLFIRENGGYMSSVKNRNSEIVDLLLYAPGTKCYELIKATFDRIAGICYSDIWLYRSFVREYGRPDPKLDFLGPDGTFLSGTWDDLNEESVLKSYGYNVSAGNGLTVQQRRELLMEIVDLEILSVAKVVRLLSFFIDSHTLDKDTNARFKWKEDLEFIKQYNVNPERFLIAGNVCRHR